MTGEMPGELGSVISTEERFINMSTEVGRLAIIRAGVPYFGSYWECFHEMLANDSAIQSAAYGIIQFLQVGNPRIQGDQAFTDAYKIHKSMQAEEVRLDPNYPLGREQAKGWVPSFLRLGYDRDYLDRVSLQTKLPIASTVIKRMAPFRGILASQGLSAPLRLAEFGCGLGINLAMWSLVDRGKFDLSYKPLKVIRESKGKTLEDSVSSDIFTSLINQNLDIELGINIDIFNAERDVTFREWAASNSLRPADYLDPSYKRELTTLLDFNNHPDELHYLATGYDFPFDVREVLGLKTVQERIAAMSKGRALDSVLASQTYYQNSQAGVATAIRNADLIADRHLIFESRKFIASLKKPDGEPLIPKPVSGYDHFDCVVIGKEKGEKDFQEIMLVDDPRPNKVMLLPAFGRAAIGEAENLPIAA